jgi:Protein of unknown function (DUF3302)
LGFKLDGWDWITFAVLLAIIVIILSGAVLVLGIPGKIAIARDHPDAEAVNIMGWLGFLAVVPWIQAFGWAFKPTQTVDVRRFPQAEQHAINAEITKLKGPPGEKPAT